MLVKRQPRRLPDLLAIAALAGVALAAPAAATDGTAAPESVENQTYKLRYEGIQRCGSNESLPHLFGFAIRVAPKVGKLFVAPRDVSLVLGGVILEPVPIDTSSPVRKPPAKCAPLLLEQELRAGQSARGYVLFELPASFLSAQKPLALVYKPTRWGGAPRAAIDVPACLADCAPPPPAAKRK